MVHAAAIGIGIAIIVVIILCCGGCCYWKY